MATVTHITGAADTSNTPNTCPTAGTFTPTAGRLLVVGVVTSNSGAPTGGSMTASANGITFSGCGATALAATSTTTIDWYIANQLTPASPAAMTVTWTPTDAGTGTVIFVCEVAGMTRAGAGAVRQTGKADNQAAASTPAPVFGVAVLTGNPTLGLVGNASSPAGLTPPTGWTEPATTGDLGYATPTTGGEYVHRDSGFTGTTVTWGSTSATAFGALVIELDTSAPDMSSWGVLAG